MSLRQKWIFLLSTSTNGPVSKHVEIRPQKPLEKCQSNPQEDAADTHLTVARMSVKKLKHVLSVETARRVCKS